MLTLTPTRAAWLLTLACAMPAAAQTTQAYDLPAQPLSTSLGMLGQQAGISVLAPQDLVAGHTAPALSGTYSVQAALDALLAGSGLSASLDGRVATIQRPAASTSSSATELAPVTVTGTLPTIPTNAVSVDRLTRADLDRFPPTSTGDLFRDIPGVMSANNRNGLGLDLNIRGMQGFGRVKILVDGTDSSSSSYKGYGGESSRAYVDPELLSEVTVEKGPNTGPYGAGVVGGVVSLNTLSASDLIQDGNSYGVRLRGTFANNRAGSGSYEVPGPGMDGSADPNDSVTRTVSLPRQNLTGSFAGAWRVNDKLDLVAGYSHRRNANYASGSRGDVIGRYGSLTGPQRLSLYKPGDEVYNTSQDTESLLFKAGLSLPQDQRLDLGFSRFESDFGEARSAAYEDYIAQLNLNHVDKKLYTAKYAWTPAGNPWIDLHVNLWLADSKEYQASDIRGIATITGTHRAQNSKTRGRGMEAWNSTQLELFGTGLNLKYGLTWMHETIGISPLDGGIYMEPNGRRIMQSQFVQAEWTPLPSLAIQAGLRHESYEVRGEGEVSSGIPGQILPLAIDHHDSRTNPNIGINWQATRMLQVFGRYSEGWRPPSAKETINGLLADSNIGRALLRPEFVRSTEAGLRLSDEDLWLAGDRFDASLAFFRNKTEDYIYGFAGEFRNAGSADFRGLEFNLAYDMGTVFARYAMTRYTKVSFCGVTLAFDGAPPCFTMPYNPVAGWDLSMSGLYIPPKAQHSVTVGTRLLDRKLQLGMRVTAARDYAGSDGMSPTGWRSYHVIDLFGSYRINKHLNVNASIENLRDQFYMDASTAAMLTIPAPGRTAKLSLTYTY